MMWAIITIAIIVNGGFAIYVIRKLTAKKK